MRHQMSPMCHVHQYKMYRYIWQGRYQSRTHALREGCKLVRSTPQSVEPPEQASSGSSNLSHPSSIGFSLRHAQKVQLDPVQLCIKLLGSSGTGGPRSLTQGNGSKLILNDS